MIPKIIQESITEITVDYIDFDGNQQSGQIVCNKNVSEDIINIFNKLFDIKFPIAQINTVDKFDNDDVKSVMANNTSCFNFRFVIGSNKLSDHSTGNAVDINPMQNPWIHPSAHKIEGRGYDPTQKGTINRQVIDIFNIYGWKWGGIWKNPDYQHFFKPDNELKQRVANSDAKLFNYKKFITFVKNKKDALYKRYID